MPARSAIVRVGLGVLLLATAGLKLYGLSVSAVPQVGWFSQPWVQLLTAEWELLLGAWLLSGAYPRLSWLAALGTFLAFAGVSGYLGWVGVASCGCFGAIEANPWWAFGVDVTAVALLTVSRPASEAEVTPQLFRTAGAWVGTVALTCGLLVVGASVYFGSLEMAVARLRGEQLIVVPSRSVPVGHTDEMVESAVSIHNCSEQPVRLLGSPTTCSCLVSTELPCTIPPGEVGTVRVVLRVLENDSGFHSRTLHFWTDSPTQRTLPVHVAFRVE